MLWQHDPAEPIGLWLALAEDARGLRVEGRLNPSVQRAREVAALMGEGALDGLSIGFRVVKAVPERGGRRLVALDLWEVSLVTFPLQPGARVLTHACADPPETLAETLRAQARRMRPASRRPTHDLTLRCRREASASKETSMPRSDLWRSPSRPLRGTSG